MTISVVIKTLTRLLEKHGDIVVALAEDQGDHLYLTFPDCIATMMTTNNNRYCVITDTEIAASIADIDESFTATGTLQ